MDDTSAIAVERRTCRLDRKVSRPAAAGEIACGMILKIFAVPGHSIAGRG
jgi:hypothetical protein